MRTNSGGAFTGLVSPRQMVPLMPYALYAAEAGSVAVTNYTGPVSESQLPPNVALLNRSVNAFTGAIHAAFFNGNGAGLTNIPWNIIQNLGSAATNPASAFQPASTILTNLAATGANTNAYVAGGNITLTTNGSGVVTIAATGAAGSSSVAAGTNVTVQTNGTVYTINANSQTNLLGSAAFVSTNQFIQTNTLPALTNQFQTTNVNLSQWSMIGTNQFLGTNVLPGLTNNFITTLITNGLATTNYVNAITNGLATTVYVNTATNNLIIPTTNQFVTVSVTNGLATTNYVIAATNNLVIPTTNQFVTISVTNGLATTTYVNTATNGFVGASITNGLATTNFVIAATNNLIIPSTNGFVTVTITNGLATTNYVNAITNGLATTAYVVTATNAGNIVFTNQLAALTNQFQTTNVNLSQWAAIGTNQFAGTNFGGSVAVNMTNAVNQFAGSYIGNGSGLTNIYATNLNNGGSSVGQILTATSTGATWSNAPSGGGGQSPSANLTNWSNISTNQVVFTNNYA